ncbi:tyrosine-type recombinase/integrase [Marimonas sp. MJW-29]|uniref:Tyrosine-type recombinase/integrase n=1 Tax=Sulfitobacter sediminis TaxID=3234186 RepID=A0ABV3RND7_9RHOB
MAHIPYTIFRSGTFYYNRRVPKHAVEAYGQFIRQALSQDPDEAAAYAERLSNVLEASWVNPSCVKPVDVAAVVESFKPRSVLLSEMSEEYLSLRRIDETPPRSALATFISLAGNRDVAGYTREDAKLFVCHLLKRGNKTATIRRRINSLSAILNYAYSELDIDKRNPFTRLLIQGEGEDSLKRGTFTNDQLKQGYDKALSSGSTVKLLMPLLGETGCRLAEIVGLKLEDIDLQEDLIHIRPNSARRLKTPNSTRTLPLVGYAKLAIEQVIQRSEREWLFPRYIKGGTCKATHASNALNKWLKRDFEGMTAHCLRHTMRDRLRALECPNDLIDQIGGWRTVGGVGVSYGRGYAVEQVREWLQRACL